MGEASADGNIVREHSPDGSACRIVYSRCAAEEVVNVIQAEIERAHVGNYTLEWKVYGHDGPSNLSHCLRAAGFVPDAVETVLAFPVTKATLLRFDAPSYDIRRIHDAQGLHDSAVIAHEIGRSNVEAEMAHLTAVLRDTPDKLSVYVAYVAGQPVASGRIYFPENSLLAELAGGRTKTTHRNQGFFTALVATRLREALARGYSHVLVDALPTSEAILRKRGFQFVTHTQPFVYERGTT